MDSSTLLSTSAAICITAGYVPQAYRTIRTRSTASSSLPAYLLLFVGSLLWMSYGLTTGNLPITLSNGITAVLAGIILALKITATPAASANALAELEQPAPAR